MLVDHIPMLGDHALSCDAGVDTLEYHHVGFRGIWTGNRTHLEETFLKQSKFAVSA
jgi:hypothetical protein